MLNRLNNKDYLILVLGCAVVLRLLLMPFFSHVDLYSEYRRVFYVLENELFFENSYRFVTFWLELIGAAFSTLFIDVSDGLFHLEDHTKSTANLTDYGFFLNDPNIFRHLFFFKLPYLIFDIATAVVIWKFIDNPVYKRLAILIWLFNPVTIFATYIFGRFEVFGLFFLALTALQLKNHRLLLACVCFALSLHCREINLLFFPYLLIALIDFKDHWLRTACVLLLSTLIVLGVYFLPDWVLSKLNSGPPLLFVDPTAQHDSEIVNKLFSLGYYWFYPIIICFAGLAYYCWEQKAVSHAERFVVTCACVLFVFFAFNSHSVHYSSWLVIFPILSMAYGRKVLFPFVAFSFVWVCLWLLKTDAGVFTLFLAAPLNPDFIGLGHFPTLFAQYIASEHLTLNRAIEVVRSLFFVTMAFFAFRVLKRG